MALPGLSLPGLGLAQGTTRQSAGVVAALPTQQTSRTEELAAQTEWRFEASFSQPYSVRLTSGHAEIFGVELAPNQSFDLRGCKGAIFTWQGCQLEITGEAESEYAAQETEYAIEWMSAHGMLETIRGDASSHGGPRVLVVGPDNASKSSLVRSLAGWAVRLGRMPTVVNLDPREGLLAPPSSLTAAAIGYQLDVESGYGISGISGPTQTPTRAPLIYHYPFASPMEKPDLYKAIITRMALSVTNRLEDDPSAKQSGLIIDTPGVLNDPKSNYDLLSHIVSEFSITAILSISSERLFNDLTRRYSATKGADEVIPVLRISKPGGAAERDATFMKQTRVRQIREYFYGFPKDPLHPHSHQIGFSELSILRVKPVAKPEPEYSAKDDDDDDDETMHNSPNPSALFEKVTPSMAMTGSIVAIKFCPGNSDEIAVRDSAVMGYLYVADVDETRKKVRFLAPHPQRWGDRALVWGSWPEAVADLVT